VVRFTPGHFNPGVRVHVTHLIGGWEDPTVGLDAVAAKGKKNITAPAGSRIPVV